MRQPFPDHFKDFADGLGIGLYQKLSVVEASEVLQCSRDNFELWASLDGIESIQLPKSEIQFFGYQLIKYLIRFTTDTAEDISRITTDEILGAPEVEKMTGLSRASIWRYQNKGEFPERVKLGSRSVGWQLSEIQAWMKSRQRA